MPEKYFIRTEPAQPHFEPVSRLVSIEKERCLGCTTCAKRDCIYDVYKNRSFLSRQLVDTSGGMCKACMRCVQECRNNIIAKTLNPSYATLGNHYWTPQIIASLHHQAETGKIPVSGAGYDGPFTGPGFDSMWTDMSEIVRPTRDGIHGREYISTSVDIGRKLKNLKFKGNTLESKLPPCFSIPLPIIIDLPEPAATWNSVKEAAALAADNVKTLFVTDDPSQSGSHFVPRLKPESAFPQDKSHKMVEISTEKNGCDTEKTCLEKARDISGKSPETVVCVGLKLDENTADTVSSLAHGGIGVFRLYADMNGNGHGNCSDLFITDMLRRIHLRLVEEGTRDCVTLIAGGGIAMAEHVAKIIACGADLVAIEHATLAALECRICRACEKDEECALQIKNSDHVWGAQRIVNLLGSWHSQLLEVMGAMGIREVRRLRGETGRIMVFEDLEKECFAPIFGKRRSTSS